MSQSSSCCTSFWTIFVALLIVVLVIMTALAWDALVRHNIDFSKADNEAVDDKRNMLLGYAICASLLLLIVAYLAFACMCNGSGSYGGYGMGYSAVSAGGAY